MIRSDSKWSRKLLQLIWVFERLSSLGRRLGANQYCWLNSIKCRSIVANLEIYLWAFHLSLRVVCYDFGLLWLSFMIVAYDCRESHSMRLSARVTQLEVCPIRCRASPESDLPIRCIDSIIRSLNWIDKEIHRRRPQCSIRYLNRYRSPHKSTLKESHLELGGYFEWERQNTRHGSHYEILMWNRKWELPFESFESIEQFKLMHPSTIFNCPPTNQSSCLLSAKLAWSNWS